MLHHPIRLLVLATTLAVMAGGAQAATASAQAFGPSPAPSAPPGAVIQSLSVPGGTLYVVFQNTPQVGSAVVPATSAGFIVQYAYAELCPNVGGCSSWQAYVYGDWEYNGSTAYTVSGPTCHHTDPGPATCHLYANGASTPHNMTWKLAGLATTGIWIGADYYVAIYLWGNGGHSVGVSP